MWGWDLNKYGLSWIGWAKVLGVVVGTVLGIAVALAQAEAQEKKVLPMPCAEWAAVDRVMRDGGKVPDWQGDVYPDSQGRKLIIFTAPDGSWAAVLRHDDEGRIVASGEGNQRVVTPETMEGQAT